MSKHNYVLYPKPRSAQITQHITDMIVPKEVFKLSALYAILLDISYILSNGIDLL